MLFEETLPLSPRKDGFSFLSVYSIGVTTGYDTVTGEWPVKFSMCCWFPLGVRWELQGTVACQEQPHVHVFLSLTSPFPLHLGWGQSPKAQYSRTGFPQQRLRAFKSASKALPCLGTMSLWESGQPWPRGWYQGSLQQCLQSSIHPWIVTLPQAAPCEVLGPHSSLLEAVSLAGVGLFRGDREVGGHRQPAGVKAERFEISGLKSRT